MTLRALVRLGSCLALGGLVASCAHPLPLAKAVPTAFHLVETSAALVQDSEHLYCDSGVPLTQPLSTCTAAAHMLGLSDAQHAKFLAAFQTFFADAAAYGKALQAWRQIVVATPAGTAAPTPPSDAPLVSDLSAVTALANTLTPGASLTALLNQIANVQAALATAVPAVTGGVA